MSRTSKLRILQAIATSPIKVKLKDHLHYIFKLNITYSHIYRHRESFKNIISQTVYILFDLYELSLKISNLNFISIEDNE